MLRQLLKWTTAGLRTAFFAVARRNAAPTPQVEIGMPTGGNSGDGTGSSGYPTGNSGGPPLVVALVDCGVTCQLMLPSPLVDSGVTSALSRSGRKPAPWPS